MNKLALVAVGSAVAAVGSLIVSAYTTVKQYRLSKKIRKSLGDIEEMSNEKITESLIEKAVNKSADKKVGKYLDDTEVEVLKVADRDLIKASREAVDKYSADIRKKAAVETAKQVSELDIDELKIRVCDEAEKHVIERLDECMNSYARKFESQMDQNRKLCDKIAKAALERDLDDNNLRVLFL